MKKALVVAYYLNDENMGAIRLRRIAKYLSRFGIEPTVLTASPERVVVNDIPGCRIERVAALDLKSVYEWIRGGGNKTQNKSEQKTVPQSKNIGFTAFLNRWLMIPDKQVPWLRPAVTRGKALIDDGAYDLIFASLEPRTNLLVAARLAQYSGLPCVMEYRDLWTNNPYSFQALPSPIHRRLHAYLEKRVLSRAKQLSAVCIGLKEYLLKNQGGDTPIDVDLNYNFFDADEFSLIPKGDASARPFTVVYTGAMYPGRNPEAFFDGVRKFLDKYNLSPSEFVFRWVGVIASVSELSDILNRNDLHDYIDFSGQVSHQEALQLLLNADASLILHWAEDKIHIPGKLFEAMGAHVPILALANPCEVTDIIDRTHSGLHVPYSDDAVATALGRIFELKQSDCKWRFADDEIEKFSAGTSVRKLAELFERVVG